MKVPQNYQEADALFTSDLSGFKNTVAHRVKALKKHDEESTAFRGSAPQFGIMLFRARQEIALNPTNPAWAGQSQAKALETLFGEKLDKLTHESSCMNAFRLAYVGETGPVSFATPQDEEKSQVATRNHYFTEKDYLGQSANTLRKVSSILTRAEEKPNAMKHPAVLEACAVIRSSDSTEIKAKKLTEILDRLDKKTGDYKTPEQFAAEKAAAEKAAAEKPGFNLADPADRASMAGQLAKADMGALLAQVVVEAQTAETTESKDALLACAASIVAHLSSKDGVDVVRAKFGELVKSALMDITAKADAMKAGAQANLAPGVALIK